MTPNNIYFVSGIDTDCGKTFVTGKLAKVLLDKGKDVSTFKLVQTGCSKVAEDIIEHRKLMNVPLSEDDKNGKSCGAVFEFPASPHLAAQLENKEINIPEVKTKLLEQASQHELLLCEGAGGLHVPLTTTYKLIDFIREYQFPLILVSSSKLGSINHTLLSLESCKTHGINVHSVIYNEFPDHDKEIAEDSFDIIKQYIHENMEDTIICRLKNILTMDLF
ncbi:MAG: dethiobiotin synthase [Bacteroidales bacterium]|nr:dethiobiotin synthase [Bacteroidales bacterium]